MDKHLLCEKAMKMEKTLNAHNVHGSSAMGAYQPHQNWARKGSNPSVQGKSSNSPPAIWQTSPIAPHICS
ncbi:hypothetical protein Tco_1364884 [Tanacetum coccineum]